MIALRIHSMKNFMNQLLVTDSFDSFLLEEAVISTMNTFTIDGRINRDFYTDTEIGREDDISQVKQLPAYEFRPWSDIKPLCYDLIKGRRTPLFFRFVLQLKPENASRLLEKHAPDLDTSKVKALVLNIRYDGLGAVLTTGTSYHTFLLSKEADLVWDQAFTRFLTLKGIEYEELS